MLVIFRILIFFVIRIKNGVVISFDVYIRVCIVMFLNFIILHLK